MFSTALPRERAYSAVERPLDGWLIDAVRVRWRSRYGPARTDPSAAALAEEAPAEGSASGGHSAILRLLVQLALLVHLLAAIAQLVGSVGQSARACTRRTLTIVHVPVSVHIHGRPFFIFIFW